MLNRRLRITGLASLVAITTLYLDARMSDANAQRQSVGEMRRYMQKKAEENREFHRRNSAERQRMWERANRADEERRRNALTPRRPQTGATR